MAKKEKKELSPEELQKLKEKEDRRTIVTAVFSGSVIYTVIGSLLALGWSLVATIGGVALIVYSIIQFIWVLAHKNLSKFETNFFAVVNFIPYLIFSMTEY